MGRCREVLATVQCQGPTIHRALVAGAKQDGMTLRIRHFQDQTPGESTGFRYSKRRNPCWIIDLNIFSSSVSPESGIDTSRLSFVDSEPNDNPIEEEVYTDAEPPVLGTAVAMFAFDREFENISSMFCCILNELYIFRHQ